MFVKVYVKRLLSGLEKKVGKHYVRSLLKQYSTTARTLDLGCGQSVLAEYFPDRVGLDIQRNDAVNVEGDAHHLPFKDDSFKQIVCSEVLEHLQYPGQAVREMHRILESEGKLVLTVPFVYPLHEGPHDYQRFTEYGLKTLFDPFFHIEKIDPIFSEEQTLAILLQRTAFQRRDGAFRYYFYLFMAHCMFRFSKNADQIKSERFQGLGSTTQGTFLTANYLLVGRNREKE